jgi:hypothetical protein
LKEGWVFVFVFCFCRFLGEFEVDLLRHRFYMQP